LLVVAHGVDVKRATSKKVVAFSQHRLDSAEQSDAQIWPFDDAPLTHSQRIAKVDAMDFGKFVDVAEKLHKVYEIGGKVNDAYEAASTLKDGITEENDSARALILMEAFLRAVKLFADGVPLLDKFLDFYADALHNVAKQLVKLFTTIRLSDEAGGIVLHPGTWPGGWGLNYVMKRICLGETVGKSRVTDEVIDFLKSNTKILELTTGEDPLPSSWVVFTDDDAVRSFICRRRCWIKVLAYSSNTLEDWGDASEHCNPNGDDEMCVSAPNDCFY
jgi:hypothetical protein